MRWVGWVIVLQLVLLPVAWGARDFRSINTDVYEISIQKNGLADVTLASREACFRNAYPLVWLEGETAPRMLDINGRNTERTAVNNALGQGQGLLFMKGDGEWVLQAYPPSKPFFVVQAAFINDSRKPVKVKMLSPWCIGGLKSGEVMLGAGTGASAILDNGPMENPGSRLRKLADGAFSSQWSVALYNAQARRFLLAGFLTSNRAFVKIAVNRSAKAKADASAKADVIDEFRAECIYDPPVEVPPGGRLESEVLYVSVGDENPLAGLEGFAAAAARLNRVNPSRALLPHGWDSWNTKFKTDIGEDNMIAALDFIDANLKRYGWTHFALDAGWEKAKGDWEPNEKFPHGMRWFSDEVHKRGMTAGIWIDPFTVNVNTPLAKQHPEWLAKPNLLGRTLMEKDELILDVTAPGAAEYVRALFGKIGNDWGFDALVEADFVYRLLFAESYSQKNLTRVDVFRLGMKAVRAGFGEERFITSMPPMNVNAPFVDSMRIGDDCAPIWRKMPDKWPWGCVEAMTNAAHHYYCAPYLWATDPDCAYFGLAATRERWSVAAEQPLTWNQTLAWLTGAALTGGVVKIGDYFPDLEPRAVTALSRLLPTMDLPARPIDLFEREHPCIWSLPIKTKVGDWQIAAVFNWDEKNAQKIPLPFDKLGLSPKEHYTVFDFWQEQYFGLAQGQLLVDTAPGSVHLLGLRRFEGRPMFLATDRHFSMGATDCTALYWNEEKRKLTGTFNAVVDTDYVIRVLVPEGYTFSRATVENQSVSATVENGVLKIAFHVANQPTVMWGAEF
jgi:hypothetical protein